jgi:hypothetical protein
MADANNPYGLSQSELKQIDAMAAAAAKPNPSYTALSLSGIPGTQNVGTQLQAQETRVRGGQLNSLTNALNAKAARSQTAASTSALQTSKNAAMIKAESLKHQQGLTAADVENRRAIAAAKLLETGRMDRARITQEGKATEAGKLATYENKAQVRQEYSAWSDQQRKPQQVTNVAAKELQETSLKYTGLREGLKNFKDAYAPGIKIVGDFHKWVASDLGMFASQEQKDMANWWRKYGREVAMNERHELFGSAFTETEKKTWREIDISPGMSPEDARRAIKNRMGIVKWALEQKIRGMSRASRSPLLVRDYAGHGIFDEIQKESGEIKSGSPTFQDFLNERGMDDEGNSVQAQAPEIPSKPRTAEEIRARIAEIEAGQ